jgi:hypothetical protein
MMEQMIMVSGEMLGFMSFNSTYRAARYHRLDSS